MEEPGERSGRWRRGAALCLCVLAAAPAAAQPWTLFVEPPVPDVAVVNGMTQAPDGSIVCGGSLGEEAWLFRVDASGALDWQRRYGPSLGIGSAVVDVEALADGSVLALATQRIRPGGDSAEARLLRVDAAGSVLSSVALGAEPIALDVATDGSAYVLLGELADAGSTIVRLDPSGAVQWAREVDGLSRYFDSGDVAALSDGGYAVLLPRWLGGDDARSWMARGDAAGSLLWQLDLDAPTPLALSLRPTGDGALLVLEAGKDAGAEATVHRVELDGTLRWSRAFALDPLQPALALDVGGDGGAAVIASSLEHGAQLLALDALGVPEWLRRLGTDAFGLVVTRGGFERSAAVRRVPAGFLVAGTVRRPPPLTSGQVFVALLDDSGNSDGCLLSQPRVPASFRLGTAAVGGASGLIDATVGVPGVRGGGAGGALASSGCALACAADAQEPDDDCAGAPTRAGSPLMLSGNFCNDSDDWLRLDACAGESWTIETDFLAAETDTRLELFADDCTTLLASDDDSGPGLGSRIVHLATVGERLVVHVSQSDGSTGPRRGYRLVATAATPTRATFLRRVGPPGALAGACAPRPGGGFVVGALGSGGAWMHATDESGAVDWCVAGGMGSVSAPAADGGALLTGRTSSSPYRLVLTRVDGAGRAAWQFALDTTDTPPSPEAAVEMPDGGFLVVGGEPSAGAWRAWALRLDAAGAIVWERALEVATAYDLTSVVPVADGGAYVGGLVRVTEPLDTAVVARIDASGGVTWMRRLGTKVTTPGSTVVTATADGGVVVAAAADVNATSTALARFDAAGTALWTRAFVAAQWLMPTALDEADDGGILLAATWRDTSRGFAEGALVARFDALGRPTWARMVRGGGLLPSGAGLGVQCLPGGDVLAMAAVEDEIESADAPSLAAVRLDALGRLDSGCAALSAVRVAIAPVYYDVRSRTASVTTLARAILPSAIALRDVPSPVAEGCPCDCPGAAPPSEVSATGSVEPLRVDAPGRLQWERATISGACRFNLYRGDLARLRGGGSPDCLQPGLLLDEAVDAAIPPPGGAWFYVVTGASDAGEGTMGWSSRGVERVNASPCP